VLINHKHFEDDLEITAEERAYFELWRQGYTLEDIPESLKTAELCMAAVQHDA